MYLKIKSLKTLLIYYVLIYLCEMMLDKQTQTLLSIQLFEKLQQREIGKGELDVVQTDFNNWNRYDLLIKDVSKDKNSHVKFSYLEYLWVRIVDSLHKYGISYVVIKDIKKIFIDTTLENEFKEIITTDEVIAQVKEQSEEAAQGLEMMRDSVEFEESMLEHLKSISTYFQLLLSYVVVSKMEVKLLVNQSGEFDVLIDAIDEDGSPTTIHSDKEKQIECSPHLCIPLSHLATKYLQIDALECCTEPAKPITKDEHTLLKIIRGKNYGKLETITICYAEGVPEMIKVKNCGKNYAESRYIEHLQKGQYGKISYNYVDGNIVSFTNERNYKLSGTE